MNDLLTHSNQLYITPTVRFEVDNPLDRAIIEQSLNGQFDAKDCIIRYYTTTGSVIFALNNYIRDENIGIAVIGFGNWCRKSIFNHLFSHIFDVLNVKRASVLIRPSNRKSIKLIKQLGFVHECDLRGMDYSQYSLLPGDSKYYGRIK